jgi:hypothetical protein
MKDDLIKREDAINALNECVDIKGYAYTSLHDAIMEIPSVETTEKSNEVRIKRNAI